jgi:hypothetical protein
MKVIIEITSNDTDEEQQKIKEIVDIFNRKKGGPGQQKINKNNSDKKVLCATCEQDLYELYEPDEAKKVISYSNDKIGKTLCRDCQKKHWEQRGGDA